MNIFPQNPVLGQNFDFEGKTFTFIGEGWILRNKIIETDPIFQKWVNSGVLDGIVKDPDYNHTDNNLTDELVEEIGKVAGKQESTDNSLTTTSKTVAGAINELKARVDENPEALSFPTIQALITAFNGYNADLYIVGQDAFIAQIGYSDTWIYEISETSVPYTYTTDDAFETALQSGVQIGFYVLQPIEFKTNLINYYTKTEIDNGFQTKLEFSTDIEADKASTTKVSAIKYMVDWISLNFAKVVDYFSKTESDRRFVNQNGGTIYHTTRWFTPTSALTIAANGLSATITSGQFTSGMTGAKLRLTGGVNEPIITYVSTNSITLSFAVDASFFGQSVAVANWGVYNKQLEFADGIAKMYAVNYAGGYRELSYSQLINDIFNAGNTSALTNNGLLFSNARGLLFNSGSTWGTTGNDSGLSRNASGILEINNGTAGTFRDLKLRSLFADKIIPNSDTTGVVIRNAADVVDKIALNTQAGKIDIYTAESGAADYSFRTQGTAVGAAWAGRIIAGGATNVFLMGQYNNQAWLGAHTANLGAWADFYINPDGAKKVFIGNHLSGRCLTVNNATGNTGLSTETPETKLDVNGTTTLRDWVYLNNGTHTGDAVGDKRFKITSGILIFERCTVLHTTTRGGGTWVTDLQINAEGVIMPKQAATAPTYVKGGMYFDTTLNKMRIGGATDWETLTSL